MLRNGPLRRLLEERRQNVTPAEDAGEQMRDVKVAEWRARGYSDVLIEQALKLADKWASSMANAFAPPELRKTIFLSSYPKALENAEAWIEAMIK